MTQTAKAYNHAYAALTKCAALQTELQPHQQRVVDRIQTQPGLVVAHGLGTGKTLSSIAAADKLNMPTSVIVPAALRANYRKELERHRVEKDQNINIESLQGMSRGMGKAPDLSKNLMIVDEAHRIRDPATQGHSVFKNTPAAKRMFLTASPIYNHPADLASLVNLAAGEKVLPNDRAGFEQEYTRMEKVNPGFWGRLRGVQPGERRVLHNTEKLRGILNQWVDYHQSEDRTEFPSSKVEDIKVPMSAKQQDINDALLDKAPFWVKYKIRKGLPPSKQESKQLNSFLGMQRQVSNSPQAYSDGMTTEEAVQHSPKIQEAFKRFQDAMAKNPEHKAVVYSNYLKSGLDPYKHLLDQHKIPYGVFSGEMGKAERDQLVQDYNANKLRNLLISSAGAEGLDLKGTRQIQILDPHFNEEKINQVTGRGIRFRSHAHLPEDQRNVNVERYLSTNRPKFFGLLDNDDVAVDEYIQRGAKNKDEFNRQFIDLLKPPSA